MPQFKVLPVKTEVAQANVNLHFQEDISIVERLIGAWTLVSWSEIKEEGKISYPLGEDAVGQIIYSADGHVAAQLVCKTRERFQTEDWRVASDVESARAWKEYFGYFGTFSIDLKHQSVIHHIEGSWFPNLLGTDQVRHFHFEGSQLVLGADTKWGLVRILWKRASDASQHF